LSDQLFIVDAQLHLWGRDTPERPWPAPHPPPQRGYPISKETLLFQMDLARVHRAILVPPAWEGYRNDLAIDAATTHPDRFAIMGRLDVQDAKSRALVPTWKQQKRMLGVRLAYHGPTGRQRLADSEWFWPLAERYQIPVMILAPWFLPELESIVGRHPDLRIVIDHAGLTVSQKIFDVAQHFATLAAFARYPNVAVKASGLTVFSQHPYPFPDIQDWVKRIFDAFGPTRTFWGTDLTHMTATYRECIDLFAKELSWLAGDDLRQVMGLGICDWLGWPVDPRHDRKSVEETAWAAPQV
jgi:L-fuconolactonase